MSNDAETSRPRRWASPIALLALAAVAVGCTLAQAPAAPLGADAADDVFSASRAMEHIEAISQETRPIGSAAHTAAREYLVSELESLGWDVEVQERIGVLQGSTTQSIAFVKNIVATRDGSDPTGTLVLAAHYDSVNGSLGAGDDGIGIGSIIESVRAIGDGQPRNDFVVLITDGEEVGLMGAEAFVRDDASDLTQPAVVINLEARGAAGSPLTFRTSTPNGPITAYTSAAGGVVANSAMETIFGLLQNDTDFTRFSAGGLLGVDGAIVGAGAIYHSPLDSPENLSRASLQQMGQTTLGLSRQLLDADLAALHEGDDMIVASVPWGLIRYPMALELPFALAGLAAALAALIVQRTRRAITVAGAALGALGALGGIALSAAGALGLWTLACAIDPGQASVSVGEPYVQWPYQAAIVAVTIAVIVGVFMLLRRTLGAASLAGGALLAVTVLGAALGVALPGAASVVAFPALFAAVAYLVSLFVTAPLWRIAVLTLGAVAAFGLLPPLAESGFELGLPMGGPVAALFLAIPLLLALPVVSAWPAAPTRSVRRGLVGTASVIVVVVALVATGLVVNRDGATLPRQERMMYSLDSDSGDAIWTSSRAPVSEWSARMLDGGTQAGGDDMPWFGPRQRYVGEAPAAAFDAPTVEVIADSERGGNRTVTLHAESRRGAPTIGLWVGGATVLSARVDGVELSPQPVGEAWAFGVHAEGVESGGFDLELELDGPALTVLVADRTAHLDAIAGFVAPEGKVLFQENVWVSKKFTL